MLNGVMFLLIVSIGWGYRTSNATSDDSKLKQCGEDQSPTKATCLLEGCIWMAAPTCLPLNSDGDSVTYQGQTCSTIAMCD